MEISCCKDPSIRLFQINENLKLKVETQKLIGSPFYPELNFLSWYLLFREDFGNITQMQKIMRIFIELN